MFPVILLLCALMSGCALLATFDQVEYEKYVMITTLAEEQSCTTEDIRMLLREARFLYHYTSHIANNDHSAAAAKQIYNSLEALWVVNIVGNMSPEYCHLKLRIVANLADMYAESVRHKHD